MLYVAYGTKTLTIQTGRHKPFKRCRGQQMLTPLTIIKFLCFDRDSILQIAGSRWATVVGFLFVVSAGFAREYDGEYLVAEPWHVLLPVVASVVGCFLMVVLIYPMVFFKTGDFRTKTPHATFRSTFISFLNVYWMTAPLAWIYAIPVERFLSPENATAANMLLLGIVAVWRVGLMMDCVQVLLKTKWYAGVFVVMLFCDVVALFAYSYVRGPVFMVMGGVRLTESAQLILTIRLLTFLIGGATLLVWLIGYLVLLFRKQDWEWFGDVTEFESSRAPERVSKSLWCLLAGSLLIWIPILPLTQPEQGKRWQCERLIVAMDFEALSAFSHQYGEDQLPPHWDMPPRPGYGENEPDVSVMLTGLLEHQAAPWIVERYREKVEIAAPSRRYLERVDDE